MEDGVEVLYGSEGDYFGMGGVIGFRNDFGSVGDYIDVRQCKCADCFAEEGRFLVIGFDHGQMDVRGPDLYGEGGKSGAGADVQDSGCGDFRR